MLDSQFENKLKENAKALFGQEKEPPAGHRTRFEQRLKESNGNNDGKRQTSLVKMRKIRIITLAATAAVLAGLVFLLNPFFREQQDPTLAEVRNYYSIQLEEAAEVTRLLIQQVDETNRSNFLQDVAMIENDPLPEVQMTDEDYIVLIADFYTLKIEILQNMQKLIIENI